VLLECTFFIAQRQLLSETDQIFIRKNVQNSNKIPIFVLLPIEGGVGWRIFCSALFGENEAHPSAKTIKSNYRKFAH
jgi:hypothetical protein